MAIHSSILAWGRIPWTEEPGGLWSMGSQRVGHDWSDLALKRSLNLKLKSGYKLCHEYLCWGKREEMKVSPICHGPVMHQTLLKMKPVCGLYMEIWNTPLWCQNVCSSWHNAATLVQIHLSCCLQDKLGVYHHIWKQMEEALPWFVFTFNGSLNLDSIHLNIWSWGKTHIYVYWWEISHGKRCCCCAMKGRM